MKIDKFSFYFERNSSTLKYKIEIDTLDSNALSNQKEKPEITWNNYKQKNNLPTRLENVFFLCLCISTDVAFWKIANVSLFCQAYVQICTFLLKRILKKANRNGKGVGVRKHGTHLHIPTHTIL